MITERIEAKGINRQLKSLKYGGIGLIVITIIKIGFINGQLKWYGQFLDIAILFILGIYSVIISTSKKASGRIGQFIEWRSDSISYKLKGQTNTINYNKITNISTEKYKIILRTEDNLWFELDISDFKRYDVQKKIKSNFEKLNKNKA